MEFKMSTFEKISNPEWKPFPIKIKQKKYYQYSY